MLRRVTARLGRSYDREKCAMISAFIAVPALLSSIAWLSQRFRSDQTTFLLVPPLAVIVFLIFSRPNGEYTAFRSVVVAPIIGAAIGELCYRWFGPTPLGVAIATSAVLCMQVALGSKMPPALALAVLAMLLGAKGVAYSVDVAAATLLCWVVFIVWRRLVWSPLPSRPTAPAGSAG